MDFNGFWMPKSSQVGTNIKSKIDLNFKMPFLQKYYKPMKKSMIFWFSGVQVGSKNRSKINQNMKPTWEGLLVSILSGFWWVMEAKLGRKMEPKVIQKGIEKMMANKRHLGGVLEASWRSRRTRNHRDAGAAHREHLPGCPWGRPISKEL